MRTLAVALVLAAASAAAQSPSFPCAQAHTAREKAVCASRDLSALDRKLSDAYVRLRTDLSAEEASSIASDQRQWLAWLDHTCPAHGRGVKEDFAGCLEGAYNERIEVLQPGLRLPDGALFFNRAAYGFVAGSQAAPGDDVSSDPGFGEGTYRWPQIDHPSPAEAAFNKTIYDEAVRLTANEHQPHPTTLTGSLDADGTIDIYSTIEGANEHLIAANLCVSTYGYGAAHPLTGCEGVNYSLTNTREITVDDLFRKDSGYLTALVPLIVKRLPIKPGEVRGVAGWDEPGFRKSALAALTHPSYWTLSKDGLTLTFGQYEVAPYAEGMPEVKLSWTELKPFLNPAFHPDEMPALLAPANQ